MSRKKTLMILTWNMDIGGIQKRIRDIINYISQQYPNWQVELLVKKAYKTPLLKEVQKIKKISICYFNKLPKRTYGLSFFWLAKQYLLMKPHTVLTFLDRLSIQMVILKKIFFWHKAKLVLNEGIYTSKYLAMYEGPIWNKLVKIFYPLADKIIVPTKAIKKDLKENFLVPSKKISIVPHWVLSKPKKGGGKKYDFIYIGRLEKEKNIFILLDLIYHLKQQNLQARLCILGKGTLENSLHLKIRQMGLIKNIFSKGFKEKVDDDLRNSKILLLPSLNEGMPNCVLEAASHKIPSIIYNFKGANEVVISGETGFIVKNRNDFFQRAKELLANKNLQKQMGIKAYQQTLKKFGEKNLRRFINIILY